jgi:predicted permease
LSINQNVHRGEILMRSLRALWKRICGLLVAGNADLDAEIESHLQLHMDDNLRAGMTPEQARRNALVKLGGVEQTRQAHREQRGLPSIESIARDVVFAIRVLRKSPGFTVIAILTLALGIGANTAMFSVVNGVLLNPLPYPHPEELVTVHESKENFAEGSISYPNFRDWQRENKTLAALAVVRNTGYNVTGLGDAEEVHAELVSSSFFPILDVQPLLGRLFAPGEDEIGSAPVAIIGAGFWARKFGSRPDVIGKPLTLDGIDYTIVGVLPPSFRLAINNFRASDIYVPIGQFRNPALNDRAAGLGIHGIARLKPGVTLAQAQADMERVSIHLEQAFPEEDKGIRARLVPFQDALVRDVKPLLLVLLGAVGFVLLIACVNVANLFLARSSERVREFAVRSALGAGRVRLVRQLLTESTLISLAGGALGLLIAALGTRTILQLLPQGLPRASEIHLSAPVLLFTLIISLGSGILFGMAPAAKLFRQSLYPTLREAGRGAGNSHHRTQDWLVVSQMAMALVLLAGAGLLIRSLAKLSSVDPGFRPQNVLTFGLQADPSLIGKPSGAQRAYLREAERRIAETPGIQAASLSWAALPMQSDDE